MSNSLTDVPLELELQQALSTGRALSELAPMLFEALQSPHKSSRLTATRFLQLHPEYKHWKDEFEPWLKRQQNYPWDLVLSWLGHQKFSLTLSDRDYLKKVFEQQKVTQEMGRFPVWSSAFEEFHEWRNGARLNLQRKILEIKDLLFQELKTWRSQRMREQEEKVLVRLQKRFPQDKDILKEIESFRQNQAFETLEDKLRDRRTRQRQPTWKFEEETTELPEVLRKEMDEKGAQFPELYYDFSILCCFCEDWVWALNMVVKAPASQARDWLELEILLKLKRYIDVLQGLNVVEMRWSHEGETFFATAYIRAQAYYGLGQKQKAFEVMESLLAARPVYRQGAELLSQWKGPA